MRGLLVVMVLSTVAVSVRADDYDTDSFVKGFANGLNHSLYGNQATTDNSAQLELMREQADYQQQQVQIQQEQLEIQREQLQAQQQANNQREWWYNK